MKSVTKRDATFLLTIALLMVLALVFGCQRRGGALEPEARAVQILSAVAHEKATKAIASQTTPLKDVRFLRLNGQEPTSMAGAETYLGNRATDGSITWTDANPPLYDRTGLRSYLVAYHPSTGEELGTKIDWAIDGKTDLLLSQVWDAGTYSKPRTGTQVGESPLTLDHMLAQIAVVFQAQQGVDLTRVQEQYGKIKSLTLLSTLPTMATYTYATNTVTYSGTPADIALWQADCQTPFAPIDIPASGNTTVHAAALLAPGSGALKMILSTEKVASIAIDVQLAKGGVDQDFEVGKKHIITVTFKIENAEVVVSGCSIVDWKAEYVAGSDVGI